MRLKTKRFVLLIALLVIVFAFAGCGNDKTETSPVDSGANDAANTSSREMIIRIAMDSDPVTLDTLKGTDGSSIGVLRETNEGLGRINVRNGQDVVEPGSAETWEMSDDGLTWTFHLREHYWSDGVPVTANDYVYAFQRMFDKSVSSSALRFFLTLENANEIVAGTKDISELGVSAPDEKTVVFSLIQPVTYFEFLIAMPAACPQRQDIVEKYGADYGSAPDKIVYNGPFIMKEWTLGNKIVYEKNPSYWDETAVQATRVERYVVATDITSAMVMLKNGEIDACAASSEWEDEILDMGTIDLVKSPFPAAIRDSFNFKSPLMQSPKVRLAISLAKDRKEINDVVYDGYYEPAYGWIMPILNVQGNNFRAVAGDPLKEAAVGVDIVALYKEGLTESGFDPEEIYDITLLLYNNAPVTKIAAELFKNQLESKLPVNVILEAAINPGDFYQRAAGPDYDTTFLHMGGALYDDPTAFYSYYLSGVDSNYGQYENTRYNELFHLAEQSLDPEERMAYLVEAERIILIDDPGISPTIYWNQNYFISKDVKGVMAPAFVPLGFSCKYAYRVD